MQVRTKTDTKDGLLLSCSLPCVEGNGSLNQRGIAQYVLITYKQELSCIKSTCFIALSSIDQRGFVGGIRLPLPLRIHEIRMQGGVGEGHDIFCVSFAMHASLTKP